jgi:hypothetical protein
VATRLCALGHQLAAQRHRARHVDPARQPQRQTFLLQQFAQPVQAFGVADAELRVDGRAIQIGGDAPLPDALGHAVALGLQLAMRVIIVERRAMRIGERDLIVSSNAFSPSPTPASAAGARRAGKTVDAPFHLRPDFGRGGSDMRLAVGDIVKLVGPDAPSVSSARRREVCTKWPGLLKGAAGTSTSSAPSARSVSIFSRLAFRASR